MKSLLVSISLMIITASVHSQGLTSQYADGDGTFLRIGPKPSQFSIPINLNFGKNLIFTSGGPISAFRRPTLKLNPVNGSVTIGNTASDFAALTIKSFSEANNTLDLRLEGDGRMGIQRSMYIDLDDDNNEDSYFLIRDSEKANLFYVGETGDSYLKGDITIDGDINLNGSIKGVEEMEIISGSDFEGDYSHEKLNTLGTVTFNESTASVSTKLNIPHNARITKIKMIYKDNSDSDIEVVIRSFDDLTYNPVQHFAWDSSDSQSSPRTVIIDNLNIVIDNLNNVYDITLFSDDWGGETIAFTVMKLFYTR